MYFYKFFIGFIIKNDKIINKNKENNKYEIGFYIFYDTLVKLIRKNDSILGFLYFKINSKKKQINS